MFPITINTIIQSDLETVWNCWNQPTHITKWNFASDDWHCPNAEVDLRVGGFLKSTMAAKDGSFEFEFGGIYEEVVNLQKIRFSMSDGRNVTVQFEELAEGIRVVETFDPEDQNPLDMQEAGWSAILNNFKKHVESL